MHRDAARPLMIGLVLSLAAFLLAACATASAAPLDVTYYYLPG